MTFSSSLNLGLPLVPDTTDPVLFSELARIYNAIRGLQMGYSSLIGDNATPIEGEPPGPAETIMSQNLNKFYAYAGVPLDPGMLGFVYKDAGKLTVEKATANSSGPKQAVCIFTGTTPITTGAIGTFIALQGLCTVGYVGLVTGTQYYLSATTPGGIESVKPVSPHITQQIGFAFSETELMFNAAAPYTPKTWSEL
jgi:hypothetical protein